MWCIVLEYAQLGSLESTKWNTRVGKRRDINDLCECGR